MVALQKYLKYSLILLILLFAALTGMAVLTDALPLIRGAYPGFFALSSAFFILSIVFWVIPWAFLIRKHRTFSLRSALILGFSCVYGALTPVQVGAEALRAIKAKEVFKVPYSEAISAAMVVKGIKFFLLALISSAVIVIIFVEASVSPMMLFGLLSGFAVIVLASALFLLPLSGRMGRRIAGFFKGLAPFIPLFEVLEKYFAQYSSYLKTIPPKTFAVVFVMAALSFAFEFVALFFAFESLVLTIPLVPLAVLFVIISILERTPVLPRGIGLVEAAGFIFLSIPQFSQLSLTTAQIGAILIVFDVVRLIIPTILSLAVSFIKIK